MLKSFFAYCAMARAPAALRRYDSSILRLRSLFPQPFKSLTNAVAGRDLVEEIAGFSRDSPKSSALMRSPQ